MEKYSQRHIGSVLELTIDEVVNTSIEDLIDQGRRFTIVKEDLEEEDNQDDE